MGNWKASRFLKSLLGFKTTDSQPSPSEPDHKQQLRRRWSLGKSRRRNSCPANVTNTSTSSHHHHSNSYVDNEDHKQAIALAAATAAAVEAAIAAAEAAAEVVRMTGRTVGYGVREELAAIKIQSCFRAYLAKRALRALKALVKLQAVVRGHILRKQTVDMMQRLQALIRAQARARAARLRITDATTKPTSHIHHGPPTPEKIEHFPHTIHNHCYIPKRNASNSYVRDKTGQERMFIDDGSSDYANEKVVEVDTGGSHVVTKGGRLFQQDQTNFEHCHSLTTSRGSTLQPPSSSPSASCEVNSFYVSMRGGVSTPVKSDGSRSCISSYLDHPNYMANTESSRAKVRSLSAPRSRPRLEVSNATKRDPDYKYVLGKKRVPILVKNTYLGSGRHDQHGLAIYDKEESNFSVGYWN